MRSFFWHIYFGFLGFFVVLVLIDLVLSDSSVSSSCAQEQTNYYLVISSALLIVWLLFANQFKHTFTILLLNWVKSMELQDCTTAIFCYCIIESKKNIAEANFMGHIVQTKQNWNWTHNWTVKYIFFLTFSWPVFSVTDCKEVKRKRNNNCVNRTRENFIAS